MPRAIYPGTFDPIHLGHIDIAERAAAIFDELVVGVYDRPAKQTLYSSEERRHLVERVLTHVPNARVMLYSGLTADFARAVGARVIVRGLRVVSDFELEYQMSLTNAQLAPEIDFVCLMTRPEFTFISSSIVREVALLGGNVSSFVPAPIVIALEAKRRERDSAGEPAPVISLRE